MTPKPGDLLRAAALILAIAVTGCGKGETPPPARYAFLAFENLSGDASLDWTGRGASEFLSRSLLKAMGTPDSVIGPDSIARTGQNLGPRPGNAPGESASREAALGSGANRLITGYVERAGNAVRITASEEDTATHRTIRTESATATSPFDALKELAREFSAQAGPAATSNPEAFRLYCTALGAPLKDALPLLERAVSLDPNFGRAWIALVRTSIGLGDRGAATEAVRRARARQLAPVDLAWVNFEDAAMSGDRSQSLAAMRKVSELEPGDAGLARSLATSETAAGNFSQAAAVWKRLAASNPQDTDAWNQLGYTLCWSGDYAGAMNAIHEYLRLRPADPNPLDSEGDIDYWFGKFGEAAANYTAAQAKAPTFLNGGEFYKAAWAKFRAGDKAAADALFLKFQQGPARAKDPATALFQGDWLYRTGRAKEARALIESSLGKANPAPTPPVKAGMAAQLAIWDLLAGDRPAAAKDLAAGGNGGMSPAVLLVRFAALPSASAAEWTARAEHDLAGPQLATIRMTALGYALVLDGKKQAAIPVWEQLVSQTAGSDFFVHNILARLRDQPVRHSPPPDPANLNQFAPVLDKL